MEIKPVKNIEEPKYPLKDEVAAEVLKNSAPKRWASSGAAKAALAALTAAALAGCTPQIPTAGVPLPPSAVTESSFPTPEISVFAGAPAIAAIRVAPLFEHGAGRGAFGCVMVTPPAFISEAEALAVINEIAKGYGLKFSDAGKARFSNVLRPATELSSSDDTTRLPRAEVYITLTADFCDDKKGVAIEYVSIDDVKEWSVRPSGSTLEQYETKDAAEQLSEALEDALPMDASFAAGVLYDPCDLYPSENGIKEDREKAARKALELSEADLKAQAEDFFKWLKSEGII